jgi:hypothetical protein
VRLLLGNDEAPIRLRQPPSFMSRLFGGSDSGAPTIAGRRLSPEDIQVGRLVHLNFNSDDDLDYRVLNV